MAFDPSVRPRDHFTPERGWLNDPNGLIHHAGEHHLFFQHHPDDLVHGPIAWGHATSTDLLTWTELPTALAPTPTEHVWSGCVVHDATHTSGLGATPQGPLVALYTGFDPTTGRQAQCVAHSDDRGRTWTRHAANPVLDLASTAFRDPKVARSGDGWLMVVAMAEERTIALYRSPDLLAWEPAGSFGPDGSVEGVWECPDLLRVPVEGTDRTAHVLLVSVSTGAPAGGSGMQYFVGVLDDEGFRATQPARWVDHGPDFYAAVSYADHPGDEPVVQAWMSNWSYADRVPASTWRGAMTLPRQLALRPRGEELVLVQRPVARAGEVALAVADRDVAEAWELPVRASTFRLLAEVATDPAQPGTVALHVRAGRDERTRVVVDPGAGTLTLDRTRSGDAGFADGFAAAYVAPLPATDGAVRLEVVVDVSSVEVVADGEVALTALVFADPSSTGIEVVPEGGSAHLRRLEVHVADG